MSKKINNRMEIKNTGTINITGLHVGNNTETTSSNSRTRSPTSVPLSVRPSQVGRAHLRRLIHEILRSDTDFDAFCLDHFSDVHRRFTSGMDLEQKINLLLLHADLLQLEHYLNIWDHK